LIQSVIIKARSGAEESTNLGLLDPAPITSLQDMLALNPEHALWLLLHLLLTFELGDLCYRSEIIQILW